MRENLRADRERTGLHINLARTAIGLYGRKVSTGEIECVAGIALTEQRDKF